MTSRARFLPEPPPRFPAFPGWARSSGAPERAEDARFAAGAAFGALHPLARLDHPLGQLWRQRLALSCAAATARHGGRSEDEASLRDALYLTREGDDPGPAGRMLQAWRELAHADIKRNPDWPTAIAEALNVPDDANSARVFELAHELIAERNPPLTAAVTIARESLRHLPGHDTLALWLADMVLAQCLQWTSPVPLLASRIKRSDLRRAASLDDHDPEFGNTCSFAYAAAAADAADLFADLSRKAERLLVIAPQLRSRDADDTISKLMREDAQAASNGKTASDRSSRRLFERLVSLGVARELTGRTTFRLYGL